MANNIPSSTADAQSTIVSRLRFPLILLVVYVHSFGIPAEDTNVPLLHSGFYEMVRTLLSGMIAHSAVPTFFFISGFLMFYRVEGYSLQLYRTKMRNRFFSLLIPYIIWNLIALGVWFVRQIDMGLAADEVVRYASLQPYSFPGCSKTVQVYLLVVSFSIVLEHGSVLIKEILQHSSIVSSNQPYGCMSCCWV